jgi:hypothetical protein
MKNAAKPCSSWTRGRFLGVAGVLLVLQASLIFLFGNRSFPRPPSSAPSIRVRALGASFRGDELARQFFAADPAVFLLPNHHGFSGRGWLDQRPMEYTNEIQLEPSNCLDFATAARLGTNVPSLPDGFEAIPAALAAQPARHEEPLPGFLAPEIISFQSVFRLEGSLRDRLWGAEPVLRAWPSAKILTNSSVQIAVNPAGEVVATRLDERCGLAEADAMAVAHTRALRFRPAPSTATQWGEAVFQWQTTEPAAAGPGN